MTARITETNIASSLFTEDYSYLRNPISVIRLAKVPIPSSPTVTIAAADWLDNASTIEFSSSNFSAVSGGRCDLVTPVTIPIRSSQVNQVPRFIRLQNNTASTTGFIDIDVNNVPGTSNAIISSISISTGNTVQITDMRFIIKPINGIKMTPALYNCILQRIIGFPAANIGYGGSLMFGWPKVINSAGSEVNAVLAISAYDGVPPESSEDAATGTLLWKRTIPTTEGSMFSMLAPFNILSNKIHTSNALATGTPTYIRVVKNAITSSPFVYPQLTLQLEVGKHVSFYKNQMATGVSNTLEQFSFQILPMP